MANKFKKLNIHEVTAAFGDRMWKRLSEDSKEEEQDELRGTWVMNPTGWTRLEGDFSTMVLRGRLLEGSYFYVLESDTGAILKKELYQMTIMATGYSGPGYWGYYATDYTYSVGAFNNGIEEGLHCWFPETPTAQYGVVVDANSKDGELLRTFYINTAKDMLNGDRFMEWLRANATKIS